MKSHMLVTGSASFIGSHQMDALFRLRHKAKAIDNLGVQVHRTKPEYLKPKVRYHFRDILEGSPYAEVSRDDTVNNGTRSSATA